MFLLLLACTEPSSDAPLVEADTGPTTASPWEYTSEESTAVLDPGIMQRELQDLVSHLREYNATPVLDSWQGVRAYGDDACPEETVTESPEDGTTTYFERLCVANGVTSFKGPMTVYDFEQNDLIEFQVADIRDNVLLDGTLWSGTVMKGQTDVYELTSDLDYNCSCTAGLASSEEASLGQLQWWTYTDGPTHWTGPEDDYTWMDEGHQSNVYLHYFRQPTEGVWWTEARGSVTGHADVYGSVTMDMMLSGSTDDYGSCAATGYIEVIMRHTSTGQSATLIFTMDPAQPCYACADVVEGESPVCIDFSAIDDWEDSPW